MERGWREGGGIGVMRVGLWRGRGSKNVKLQT